MHDRIVVKRLEEEEKIAGGIIIPDTAKEKPQQGKVLAAGDGKLRDNGSRSPLDVKQGDRILFSKYAGTDIKVGDITLKDLGQCKTVRVDKDNTTLVDGTGSRNAIEGRLKRIRAQIEETTSNYDREELQERLAKIVGGGAVIKVGAVTEVEMREKNKTITGWNALMVPSKGYSRYPKMLSRMALSLRTSMAS